MNDFFEWDNEPEIDEMGKPYKVSEFSFWEEFQYWFGWVLIVGALLLLIRGCCKLAY